MDSNITLVGNLTRDPVLRVTAGGLALAEMGIAVNRRWRDNDGESKEHTSFFSVVAWRSLAEHCAASLHKGDLVMVVGRPEQRSWQTDSGERRSAIEVVADDVGPSLRWATAAVERTARLGAAELAAWRRATPPLGAGGCPRWRRLRQHGAMSVRVGCAMWANKDWIGPVFPSQTKPGQLLSLYQRRFGAVEGNTTFYGLPAAATVQRWRADTSEDFRFLFKVPRTISHDRRLRDAGDELRAFCTRLEPLGPRLGPTSIQLPASFGPDQLEDLRRFLGSLPGSWRWSVEVRHRDFFTGGAAERALNDLLYERGVDRVLLDSRALFSVAPIDEVERIAHGAKPQLPVRPTATADHPVVRFIGHRRAEVSAAHWQRWFPVIGRWLAQGRSPTLFFHTADNVDAPAQAQRFAAELLAQIPEATITTGEALPGGGAAGSLALDGADRPAPKPGTLPLD